MFNMKSGLGEDWEILHNTLNPGVESRLSP